MKSFILDTDILKACSFAMSKEETRYYLMGVHIFEKNGSLVYEATNGHWLVQVISNQDQSEHDCKELNIIIPATLIGNIIKTKFRNDFGNDRPQIICSLDATRITLEMVDGTISFRLIDGTFPDTAKVIPEKSSCRDLAFDEIGISTKYLSDVAKSYGAISKNAVAAFAFSGETPDKPVMATAKAEAGDWLSVLMPARI